MSSNIRQLYYIVVDLFGKTLKCRNVLKNKDDIIRDIILSLLILFVLRFNTNFYNFIDDVLSGTCKKFYILGALFFLIATLDIINKNISKKNKIYCKIMQFFHKMSISIIKMTYGLVISITSYAIIVLFTAFNLETLCIFSALILCIVLFLEYLYILKSNIQERINDMPDR